MGMWDIKPWDNDEAADWYTDVMETCQIRKKWLEGIKADLTDEFDTVRAAIGLFIMLGRVYIWPIETYDKDLELAISKCESLQKVDEYQESPELLEQIGFELEELKSRRKPNEGTQSQQMTTDKKWWQFWK